MTLRLQAFLLIAISATAALAQDGATPFTIPAGVGLATIDCNLATGNLQGTAQVASGDIISVVGSEVELSRDDGAGGIKIPLTAQSGLTGVSATNNAGTPSTIDTCNIFHANPCAQPTLLEKTLAPVLQPTSQLILLQGVASIQFQVELPAMYKKVGFGFNASDLAAVGGNEAARQADQCPGIAVQTVDNNGISQVPVLGADGTTESCVAEYSLTQALSECNFNLNEDGDSPVFSGTLWVYAEVVLQGSFLGNSATQSVISPINWSVTLQNQITVVSQLVTLSNENECVEDADCVYGFCNKGVGQLTRDCGHYKIAICHASIATAAGDGGEPGGEGESPPASVTTYESLCVSKNGLLGLGNFNKGFQDNVDSIIPPFGTYNGSTAYGEAGKQALLEKQCVDSRADTDKNFCDCDAIKFTKDPVTKECVKDVEDVELICEDIATAYSKIGGITMSESKPLAFSLGPGTKGNPPFVTDNGYWTDTVLTLIADVTNLGADTTSTTFLSHDGTSPGAFVSPESIAKKIIISRTSSSITVNGSDEDSNNAGSCTFNVFVFDDEKPTITCPAIENELSPTTIGNGEEFSPYLLGSWPAVMPAATGNDARAGDVSASSSLSIENDVGDVVTGTPDGTGGKTFKLIYTVCDGASAFNLGVNSSTAVELLYNQDNCNSCFVYAKLYTNPPTCTDITKTYEIITNVPKYALTAADATGLDAVVGAHAYDITSTFKPNGKALSISAGHALAANLQSENHGCYSLKNILGVIGEGEGGCDCDIMIHVDDKYSPIVLCADDSLTNNQINDMSPGAKVLLAADAAELVADATASVNCSDNVDGISCSSTVCSSTSSGDWAAGEHTITCVGKDAAGNADLDTIDGNLASCDYIVYVADNEDPVITNCAALQTAITAAPLVWEPTCNSDLNFPNYSDQISFSDNYSNSIATSFVSAFVGVNNVKDGVIDSNDWLGPSSGPLIMRFAGNDTATIDGTIGGVEDFNVIDSANECELQAQIVDITPPQLVNLNCPGDSNVCMIKDKAEAIHIRAPLSACDNHLLLDTTFSPLDGSTFSAAATRTFTASDTNGEVELCRYTETPIDCQAPTIDCSVVVAAADSQGTPTDCGVGTDCKQHTIHTNDVNKFANELKLAFGDDNVASENGLVNFASTKLVAGSEQAITVNLAEPNLSPGLYTFTFTANDGAPSDATQLYPSADPLVNGPFTAQCSIKLLIKDVEKPVIDCTAAGVLTHAITYYTPAGLERQDALFPTSWLPTGGLNNIAAGSVATDNSSKLKTVTLDQRKKGEIAWTTVSSTASPATESLELQSTDPTKDTEYEFQLTVTDHADNESEPCTFEVTASDNVLPAFPTCPASSAAAIAHTTSELDSSVAYLNRSYWSGAWNNAGASTDNVEVFNEMVTTDGLNYANQDYASMQFAAEGSLTPKAYTIGLLVTDTSDNDATCNQKITVADNEKPRLSSGTDSVHPENGCGNVFFAGQKAVNGTKSTGAGDDYSDGWFDHNGDVFAITDEPAWFDNVSAGSNIEVTYTDAFTQLAAATSPSQLTGDYILTWNAALVLGNHVITVQAKDESGNVNMCELKILVTDTEQPTINCAPGTSSAAYTRPTDAGIGTYSGTSASTLTGTDGGVHVTLDSLLSQVKATDNAGKVDPVAKNDNPSFPLAAREEVYTFTFMVDDSAYGATPANTNECTITVLVNDNENPVITQCASPNPLAEDHVTAYGTNNLQVGPVDNDGSDVYYIAASKTAPHNWVHASSGFSATDNVEIRSDSHIINPGNLPEGSTLGLGAYDVRVSVSDPPLDPIVRSADCEYSFKIVDIYAPEVDCNHASLPKAGIHYDDVGKAYWSAPTQISFDNSVSDNVAVMSKSLTYIKKGSSDFPAGLEGATLDSGATSDLNGEGQLYTVTLSAVDAAGHITTCSYELDVRDNQNPEYTNANNEQAFLTTEGTDPSTCSIASLVKPGEDDNVLVLSGSQSTQHGQHYDCVPQDLAGADTYDPTVPASCTAKLSSPIVLAASLPVGIHTITYSMKDTSQNPQTTTITAICKDNHAPYYVCPTAPIKIALPATDLAEDNLFIGLSGTSTTQSLAGANAGASLSLSFEDNYDAVVDCSNDTSNGCKSQSDQPLSLADIRALQLARGTHAFTFTGATDSSGNVSTVSCTIYIEVVDNTPVTITATDINLLTSTDCPSGAINRPACSTAKLSSAALLAAITVTDNEMGLFKIEKQNASGTFVEQAVLLAIDNLSIGVHTFKVTFDDYCTIAPADTEDCNPATDTFTVTVTDDTAPVITCASTDILYPTTETVFQSATPSKGTSFVVAAQESLADNNSPVSDILVTCTDPNSSTCVIGGVPVAVSAPGVYPITLTANDSPLDYTLITGSEHTCDSTYTVRDVTRPSIVCSFVIYIKSEDSRTCNNQGCLDKKQFFLEAGDVPSQTCSDNRNIESCEQQSAPYVGDELVWNSLNSQTYFVSDGTPDEFSCIDNPCSTDTCTTNIVIVDNTPPELICTVDGGGSGKSYTGYDPSLNSGGAKLTTKKYLLAHDATTVQVIYNFSATDNFDDAAALDNIINLKEYTTLYSINNNGTQQARSGEITVGEGFHTLTYHAEDYSGNMWSCEVQIEVYDAMYPHPSPTGTCPVDYEYRSPDPSERSQTIFSVQTPSYISAYKSEDNYVDNIASPAELSNARFTTFNNGRQTRFNTPSGNFDIGVTSVLVEVQDPSVNYLKNYDSSLELAEIVRVGGTYTTDPAFTPVLDPKEFCVFEVTIYSPYVRLAPSLEAFLNKVFIRVLNAQQFEYGAYIEVTTAVDWPHRLEGTYLKTCNETGDIDCDDDSDFSGVSDIKPEVDNVCAAPLNLTANEPSAICRQKFGTTLAFPAGCAIADQKWHLQFKSQCLPVGFIDDPTKFDAAVHVCDAINYKSETREIVINLSADNYCGRNLADVTIEGTLITLDKSALTQYIDNHVYGDAAMPDPKATFYNGDFVQALMTIKSASVELNSVTLQSVERTYFSDEFLNIPFIGTTSNPLPDGIPSAKHTLSKNPNAPASLKYTVPAAVNNALNQAPRDYANFEYIAEVPLQTTLYTQLSATAGITYRLPSETGGQTTNRRLLGAGRVFRKVLNADNRKLLQAADGDLEGDRTSSTQYLALNLDLAADTSRINSDGNIGYGLVRVIDMPAGSTTASVMATVDTHLERELGAASVDLQFVRNDGPNAMIVAVTHNTSVSTKLQQAVTDENSQLHRNMRAAGGRPAIDPLFFFSGEVPSTNVTVTGGSDAGSDSLPAIVGGAVGGGVCCLLILFLLVRRKREAKETKSIEDAMPERVSRASSHASSNRSRRNSVGVAPVDFDGVQIAVGAADTKKSPVTPMAPAAWIDSDSD